ncbi:MAG: hypothetical protein ABSF38_00200 [Verrucomicrobiota bacterium]|jgi:hypothetical protein
MKRIIAIAILLGGRCAAGLAQMTFNLDAPQDDRQARLSVCDRPESQPLQAAYSEVIQTRLLPLKSDDTAKIFGPEIATATNWWGYGLDARRRSSGPTLARHPADLVLPIFVPGTAWVSGLHSSDPARNKNHTDLHAVGDLGYVEFYYANDGRRLETALIYFRADDKFIPLTSTNDFAKRLEWDKARFDALKKWLDDNMPKLTDLGEVEVSASAPSRLDLGGGTVCILKTQDLHATAATFPYQIYIGKETPDAGPAPDFTEIKSISHPGESIAFSLDGKFYRLTPKWVGKLPAPKK